MTSPTWKRRGPIRSPRRGIAAEYQDLSNSPRYHDDQLPDLPSSPPPMRAESVVAARARHVPNLSICAVLAMLVNRGSFHGSWLQHATGSDNVDPVLLVAEQLGWVTRGEFDPEAAGRDGAAHVAWGHLGKLPVTQRMLRDHHWLTATFKWLEADHVQEMLIGGGVL